VSETDGRTVGREGGQGKAARGNMRCPLSANINRRPKFEFGRRLCTLQPSPVPGREHSAKLESVSSLAARSPFPSLISVLKYPWMRGEGRKGTEIAIGIKRRETERGMHDGKGGGTLSPHAAGLLRRLCTVVYVHTRTNRVRKRM